MIAIGTQHVVAYETGIPDVVDPLGGSYYLETLTKEFEDQVLKELDRIEEIGGVVKGIETGYFKRLIAEDAYQSYKDLESGKKIKVGVNRFRVEEEEVPLKPYQLDPKEEAREIEELRELKTSRDRSSAEKALRGLKEMAGRPSRSENNLVPPIIEAVRAYATMGEICAVLREVYGEYLEPAVL
jgi:methylmalonyl-CoA mutase N-terminal domain/subunit